MNVRRYFSKYDFDAKRQRVCILCKYNINHQDKKHKNTEGGGQNKITAMKL
jgi:hypothetical protein